MDNNKSQIILTKQADIIAIAKAVDQNPSEDWMSTVCSELESSGIELLDDATLFNSDLDTTIVAAIAHDFGEGPESYVLRLHDDCTWTLDAELPVESTSQPAKFWPSHIGDMPTVVVHPGYDDDDNGGFFISHWDGKFAHPAGEDFFEDESDALTAAQEMAKQ